MFDLKRCLVAAVCAVSLFATPIARADEITFSNLGPGDSFNPASPFQLGPPDNVYLYMPFQATKTGTLQSVDGVFNSLRAEAPISLELAVIEGFPTNDPLEAMTTPLLTAGSPAIVTALSSLHPVISAGSFYWLRASVGPQLSAAWYKNDQGDFGDWGSRVDLNAPNTLIIHSGEDRGAYRVWVKPDAVPEASSLLLFAGAAPIGLLALRRKRSR